MNKQKILWEKLARINPLYVVDSSKGMKITEEQIRRSGKNDFEKYIYDDHLIYIDGTFLELGCGVGRMTEYIADYFQKVIATDISGEMLKIAKTRTNKFEHIQFIETNGYTLPLEDNSVDVAFSYLVFQHFKNKVMIESNFREVYRVLDMEGLFKVLVRTDDVNISKTWWGGVKCDESVPVKVGFKLIKKEKVSSYGLWLWLKK